MNRCLKWCGLLKKSHPSSRSKTVSCGGVLNECLVFVCFYNFTSELPASQTKVFRCVPSPPLPSDSCSSRLTLTVRAMNSFVSTITFDMIGLDKTKTNCCDRERIGTILCQLSRAALLQCKGYGGTEFKILRDIIYFISVIHFCINVLQISFSTDISSLFQRPATCCMNTYFARCVCH